MNFLRQGRGAFTYRAMIIISVSCILLAGIFYLFLFLQEMSMTGNIGLAKKRLQAFNEQKDKQIDFLAALGRERVGSHATQDLTALLIGRMRWSEVLKSVAKSLPSQLWLESISVAKPEGQPESQRERLEIRGRATSQRVITNFIMQLESGGQFRRTELESTTRAEDQEGMLVYDIFTTPITRKFEMH